MPARARSRTAHAGSALAPRTARAALAVAVLVLATSSCDDDGDVAVPTTTPPTVTVTTVPSDETDGVLRIGLLLPASGDGAAVGQPLIAAATTAVQAINEAGGVLDRPVELIDAFEEGSSPAATRDAIAALVDRDVDAVIGPASSTMTLATLDDLLDAGVLTCSPTATAMALDDFPGSELFVRTAPSDSLQATAIAQLADDTGARTSAVVYLDDPYGRALGQATVAALRTRGIPVSEQVPFATEDESLVDEAATIVESGADVIVVIGDGEQGARMLSQLGAVTGIEPGERPPDIIVNDAVRRPPSPQLVQELAADVRDRITGVSPLAAGTEDGEPAGAFATNAADCVNLIALAAVAADSDDPDDIRARIVDVSNGGVSCRAFAECKALIVEDNRNIDYDGPGGVVEIGEEGDPTRARFDRFGYDERGVDVSTSPFVVTA